MTRRIAVLAICIVTVVALSGCGERDESLSPGSGVVLRVAMAPLNAGEGAVYSAQASGQFQEAGVKARLSQYPDAATAIRAVQTGKADLAVGTESDLLEARGRGARVVSVAALVQSPFTSLIAPRPSPLAHQPALLVTPIGTQGFDYQRAFAETIFEKEGRRARVVDVGNDLAGALQKKKVAAVIAPFGGPPLPGGVVPVPVDRIGVPTFSEYVLVANEDSLDRNRDVIRSFIGALARGTHDLGAAREGAISEFLKGGEAAKIRKLMLPPPGKPYGWQDAAKWRKFADWMRANKLPQKGSAGSFTNELLPGEGL
jgi:putative hydroxymethylpyrimidine transport system substrate-binding protein